MKMPLTAERVYRRLTKDAAKLPAEEQRRLVNLILKGEILRPTMRALTLFIGHSWEPAKTGIAVTNGGKKGGITTAARSDRDDSRKLTIATYRQVKKRNPRLSRTALVKRVARERQPKPDGGRLSERQVWNHLDGIC